MPAYGLRQIIEVQADAGACVEQVVISGGAGQSDFVRTLLAEAGGKPVVAPRTEEPVLLGSAILGAVASGAFGTMGEAMAQLSASGSVHQPATGTIADLHEERYAAFKALQLVYRDMRTC